MSNIFRNILFMLLFCCSVFSQKASTDIQVRESVIESIISFKGDFSLDSVKVVKMGLSKLGIDFLGYCVDQKCMLVSAIYKDENTESWVLGEIEKLAKNAVLGLKKYEHREYYLQCQFHDMYDAAYFKRRFGQ